MIDERQLIKDIAEYGARYYQNNGMHNDKVTSAIDHILVEIVAKQPKVNDWISVEKALPEHTDDYEVVVGINALGLGMCNERRTALYNTVYKSWYVHEDPSQRIIGEVIAWMPIPEYKGDKND